jgi:hypothetical protein
MQNLWPPAFKKEIANSPAVILREQATMLGEKTRNLVQGEVVHNEKFQDKFSYVFFIVAPTLGHYRYKLLSLEHSIEMYPLKISVEDEILNEISSESYERTEILINPQTTLVVNAHTKEIEISSEDELIHALKAIFWAKKTRRVITNLLSQLDLDWTGNGSTL